MSSTAKALIVTWVIIGFIVVAAAGFYLGRKTAPTSSQNFPNLRPSTQHMLPGQGGGLNQPPGGSQAQPSGLPQPSGTMQQQPAGGGGYQQPSGGSQQQLPKY